MTKYAANAMLATRISFMNEMANLCDRVGADIRWVQRGIGTDHRIGSAFLFAGLGYGGSCFPKDISALSRIAAEVSYPLRIMDAVEEVNRLQRYLFLEKILNFYSLHNSEEWEDRNRGVMPLVAAQAESAGLSSTSQGGGNAYLASWSLAKDPQQEVSEIALWSDSSRNVTAAKGLTDLKGEHANRSPVRGKTFAVWGLSFKPQTDDMRSAPALTIIESLLGLGANIQAYDPEAMSQTRKILGDRIGYAKDHYEVLGGADALLLMTEWTVFRNPDFQKIKNSLKEPVVFDGRNLYDPQEMRRLGFRYFGIGR